MAITSGFNHVATLTTDLDRFAEFYGQVFGAEVTFRMDATDDHPRMFILDLGGGAALNVFEVAVDEWSLFFRDVDGMELEVCAHADDAG